MLYGRPMQIVAAAAGNAVLHTFNIAAVARADQSDGVPRWVATMDTAIDATDLTGATGDPHELRAGVATWDFEPSSTLIAAEEPDVFTLEYVEASAADAYGQRSAYGFVESFTLRAEPDGSPGMTLNMRARAAENLAAMVELPPVRLPTANARWRVYDDPSWAAMGTTPLEGTVLSFTYGLVSGVELNPSLEGRAALDFAAAARTGPRIATIGAEIAVDPAAAAYVRRAEADKLNRVTRFVRAELTGPPIHGAGTPAALLRLDGAYVHEAASMAERGNRNNNRMTRALNLRSIRDRVSGNDAAARLVSDVGVF